MWRSCTSHINKTLKDFNLLDKTSWLKYYNCCLSENVRLILSIAFILGQIVAFCQQQRDIYGAV